MPRPPPPSTLLGDVLVLVVVTLGLLAAVLSVFVPLVN
jgi:hypothetical protein